MPKTSWQISETGGEDKTSAQENNKFVRYEVIMYAFVINSFHC